jgi:hypothetical protein
MQRWTPVTYLAGPAAGWAARGVARSSMGKHVLLRFVEGVGV